MARQQYQPRKFLRDAPNELLARYFQERGLLADMDFDALKDETDIEPIYEAWQALPREQLERTEADFRAVDEMAEAEAVGIVITEGRWHGEELGPVLEQLDGMCHKMLWTFIEKPRVFDVSYPNSCPLKHDGRDLIIRQCLKDSGIDESSNAPNDTEQG